MKKIDVITLFPEIIEFLLGRGVIFQGQKNNIIDVKTYNPRNFTEDKNKNVDGRPFGGGAGMVIRCEPLEKTFQAIPKIENRRFIYLSPQGQKLTAQKAKELSKYDQLIFLCGRYEGVDERFLSHYVDEEISIGDFVLCGGEIPCAITIDAVTRFYEGLLGNQESAKTDTFENTLLKYPQYAKPLNYEGMVVPDILRSGHHGEVAKFRKKISILRTYFRREDLCQEWIRETPGGEVFLKEALKLYEDLTLEQRKTLGLPLKNLTTQEASW